jgi:cell division protein FtsQ
VNRQERLRLDGNGGFATGALALVLLFLLTVAGIAWVSLGIVTSERWPIRWLEVNGAFQRVSAEQLRANLSSRVGTNFFTVDLQDLRDAALRISWVSAVRVRKQWPDTLRVEVDEYVPVAHWNRGRLIAATGAPFAVPEADTIQGLPWLSGPDERLGEVLETWTAIDRMLTPLGREIASIRLDRRGAWSMVLDNGTQVRMGRDATGERLRRLIASWEPLVRQQGVAPLDIDLRYSNGLAVLWPAQSEQDAEAGS